MSLDEEIAFWKDQATKADGKASAIHASGVAAGLQIAKNDHLPAAEAEFQRGRAAGIIEGATRAGINPAIFE